MRTSRGVTPLARFRFRILDLGARNGERLEPVPNTKIVRAFVKQLRRKLGDDAASPVWIFNVRGVGYRMPRSGAPGEP